MRAVIFLLALILASSLIALSRESKRENLVAIRQDQPSPQYVTTFSAPNGCPNLDPWVLSPSNNGRTVWVGSLQLPQFSGQPTSSLIANFTLGANGGPPLCTPIHDFPNAAIESIVFDQQSNRVWFTFNDTLAYIDLRTGSYTTAFKDQGGVAGYIAIDSQDNIWVTLIDPGQNRIAEYTSAGNEFTTNVPTPNPILQGIAVAPDGTVWFAEAIAKKLGRLTPCGGNSCPVQEFSPPVGITIAAPTTVAVDSNGIVWFTDHGSNQFGSFNPTTPKWAVYPVGYCDPLTYCADVLPNAIALDSEGRIWFAEHIAGRVSTYNPTAGTLTEYILPSNGVTPLSWWAWPGPNKLVWFTEWGLSQIGYVNASLPITMNITSVSSTITVRQGGSQTVQARVASQSQEPLSLGISPATIDRFFFSASSKPNPISPFIGSSTSSLIISAAWNATLGPRSLSLTAFNGKVAVSTHITVNIIDDALPYVSFGFGLVIILGGPILYLRRRTRKRTNLIRQTRR